MFEIFKKHFKQRVKTKFFAFPFQLILVFTCNNIYNIQVANYANISHNNIKI